MFERVGDLDRLQERSRSDDDRSEFTGRTRSGVVVGAAHDSAERDAHRFSADFIAGRQTEAPGALGGRQSLRRASVGPDSGEHRAPARVERRLQRSAGGGGLDPSLRSDLEASTGSDLGRVRVFRSSDLPRQVGAKAFTYGDQVHFEPGAYRPDTDEGRGLVAHEVAHVVQQRAAGEPVINRFLAGTSSALLQQGGASTRVRKLGVFKKRTDPRWDQLVKKVTAHERTEERQRSSHRSANFMRPAAVKTLVKSLRAIESAADAWRADGDVQRLLATDQGEDLEAYESPEATTARNRDSLIEMLLPRVRLEIRDVESGRFLHNKAHADTNLEWSKQAAVGGNVNSLDIVSHRQQGGSEQGFFKQDRRHEEDNVATNEGGIDRDTGNWGARSVAMSRLDELLGGGVMANTEFATHGGRMAIDPMQAQANEKFSAEATSMIGTHQELATGQSMADLIKDDKFRMIGERHQGGNVNLADPELQRLLNIMQVIDAISGQLDRHAGNYFIEVDPTTGAVTNVTGIDLDQAFSPKHTGVEAGNWSDQGFARDQSHFKGVPAQIDRTFGLKLLGVSAEQVRYALEPLLAPADLEATMGRWDLVIAKIREMEDRDELIDTWDESTARQQMEYGESYLGAARTELLTKALKPVAGQLVSELIPHKKWMQVVIEPMIEELAKYPEFRPDQAVAILHRINLAADNDEHMMNRRLRLRIVRTSSRFGVDADAKERLADMREEYEAHGGKSVGSTYGSNLAAVRKELESVGLAESDIRAALDDVATEAAWQTVNRSRTASFDSMFDAWLGEAMKFYALYIGLGGEVANLPDPPEPDELPFELFPRISFDVSGHVRFDWT